MSSWPYCFRACGEAIEHGRNNWHWKPFYLMANSEEKEKKKETRVLLSFPGHILVT